AVGRQLAGIDAVGAQGHGAQLVLEFGEVEVPLPVREIFDERQPQALPQRWLLTERADELLVEGADRTFGYLILARVAEDDVLVPVVILARRADLRPFPADEGNQIRILRITGHGIALADGVLGLLPMLRRDAFGVIVEAEEIQP